MKLHVLIGNDLQDNDELQKARFTTLCKTCCHLRRIREHIPVFAWMGITYLWKVR